MSEQVRVRLSDQDRQALARLSEQTRLDQSALVRLAVASMLRKGVVIGTEAAA